MTAASVFECAQCAHSPLIRAKYSLSTGGAQTSYKRQCSVYANVAHTRTARSVDMMYLH